MKSLHTKNHKTESKNLKTQFNRERKNHNINPAKHDIMFLLLTVTICSLAFITSASALDYSSDPITLDFTFGSTLSITTGGDIVISELVPGTKSISDSNYVVMVNTNNTAGYTLAATVGCSSNNTNYGTNCTSTKNLVDSDNEDSSTNNFTMLESSSTLTSGTWGVSFDSTATENSTFDTLPLYSSSAKVINQTTNATGTASIGYTGTNNTPVRIGAYATTSQLAGTYSNVINFIAISNPTTTPIFMQDFTLSDCMVNVGQNGNVANIGDNITAYDRRDFSDYTIRYINGECWMTQNLRIAGVIRPTDSNFEGPDFNVSAYDLKTNGVRGGECDTVNGYSNPCSRMPDTIDLSTIGNDATAKSVGAWYNYCAASAGTICSDSTVQTTNDICPAGWHLPSGPNTTTGTDFNKLINNTTAGWQTTYNANIAAFNLATGGFYSGSELSSVSDIDLWSASSPSNRTDTRYYLGYRQSSMATTGDDIMYRWAGFFVRCVKSE